MLGPTSRLLCCCPTWWCVVFGAAPCRWYSQAGTPHLTATPTYNAADRTYTLRFKQARTILSAPTLRQSVVHARPCLPYCQLARWRQRPSSPARPLPCVRKSFYHCALVLLRSVLLTAHCDPHPPTHLTTTTAATTAAVGMLCRRRRPPLASPPRCRCSSRCAWACWAATARSCPSSCAGEGLLCGRCFR